MSCLIKHQQVYVKQQSQVDLDTWVSCGQCVYRLSAVYIETRWILWGDIVYSDAVQPRQGRQSVLSSCCHRWTPSSGDCACWRMFSDQSLTCPSGPTDSVTPVNVHIDTIRYADILSAFENWQRATVQHTMRTNEPVSSIRCSEVLPNLGRTCCRYAICCPISKRRRLNGDWGWKIEDKFYTFLRM